MKKESENFQPVEKIEGDLTKGLVILCDHASNNVPKEYDSLGLTTKELSRHIGYDIGVAEVTRALARNLSVPAILTNYSRLLIDPNRGEDDLTLVMQISDGIVIPKNINVSPDEVAKRIRKYYRPYHDAISSAIEQFRNLAISPVLFSIHSFTPIWRGQERPWHAGVLWDNDPRFAIPLLDNLSKEGNLIVGDNEPYSGALKHDTMYKHGTENGLAHALLEIRQDLISEQSGVNIWVDRLVAILTKILSNSNFNQVNHYGSKSEL